MRKRLAVYLLLAMFCVSAVACGGVESPAASESEEEIYTIRYYDGRISDTELDGIGEGDIAIVKDIQEIGENLARVIGADMETVSALPENVTAFIVLIRDEDEIKGALNEIENGDIEDPDVKAELESSAIQFAETVKQ